MEFYLPHGERIRLLRDWGFEIDDLVEVQAPAGGVNEYISEISLEWAHRQPSEEVWFARRGERRVVRPYDAARGARVAGLVPRRPADRRCRRSGRLHRAVLRRGA